MLLIFRNSLFVWSCFGRAISVRFIIEIERVSPPHSVMNWSLHVCDLFKHMNFDLETFNSACVVAGDARSTTCNGRHVIEFQIVVWPQEHAKCRFATHIDHTEWVAAMEHAAAALMNACARLQVGLNWAKLENGSPRFIDPVNCLVDALELAMVVLTKQADDFYEVPPVQFNSVKFIRTGTIKAIQGIF